jgi:AcrR family transcriptional regulator
MPSTSTAARPPGRPRSPEADEAIIRATLDLLAEVGYRSLSMELVRSRAGVGKATIYRRHAGKDDLIKAALRHLNHDLPVPADSGSLLGDLEQLAAQGASAAEATRLPDVYPRLLAEVSHDEELQALFREYMVAPRRAVLRAIFERAITRGEVREDADLDIAMDMLVGSVVYRGLISGIDPQTLRSRFRLAGEIVLEGLRPRAA